MRNSTLWSHFTRSDGGMPRLALRERLRFGRAVARLGSARTRGRCERDAWTCSESPSFLSVERC